MSTIFEAVSVDQILASCNGLWDSWFCVLQQAASVSEFLIVGLFTATALLHYLVLLDHIDIL